MGAPEFEASQLEEEPREFETEETVSTAPEVGTTTHELAESFDAQLTAEVVTEETAGGRTHGG